MFKPTDIISRRKLTGAELEFFERVTAELLRVAGVKRDRFATYKLSLSKEGYEQFIRAFLRLGGKLEVPAFEPVHKEGV